jgi:hypothetical protein
MAGLPCPQPLPTAIEGGIFGMEVDGPIVPDAEDVDSITEEHAREMLVLFTEIAYLQRCQAVGIVPESGRRPRTEEQHERLAARLTKVLADFRDKYEQCLDLYEQAFGAEAARQLDVWVRTSCQAVDWADTPQRQIHLFD